MAFWDNFNLNQFRPVIARILKLTGTPSKNIPQWLYEKTNSVATNPFKPHKRKKTKEQKIDVPSLQKLLIQYRDKINEVINAIDRVPELEAKVFNLANLVNEMKELVDRNTAAISANTAFDIQDRERSELHRRTFTPYVHNPLNTMTGFQKGGKLTKPVVSNSKSKEQLISTIQDKIKKLK